MDAQLARQIMREESGDQQRGFHVIRRPELLDNVAPLVNNRQQMQPEEIRDFYNAVGPALRHDNIFARGGRRHPNNDEVSVNERVNNMSEQ